MPPANSRNASPPAEPGQRPGLPPAYFSAALQELESPVLNLAATLTTQGDEDIITENSQYFPRDDGPNLESWHQRNERERSRQQRQREDVDHRDRLRRVMNRLSRIHDPPAAYGDRVPSQNNLYDWSPAHEADDEDELDQILAELRREQPNTHPDILRVLGRSQLDAERETRNQPYSSRLSSSTQPSQFTDGSLRSAAILQSVRRHPRFSARARDHLQQHNSDRESASRSPHQTESRDRYTYSENPRQAALQRLRERRTSTDRPRDRDRDREMLQRVDSYRRNYLERPASTSATVSPVLEQTINYLARLRWCNNVDDSIECAFDAGLATKDEYWEEKTDFILDTFTIPPPAVSSWLAPGAVLSGYQHATTTITSTITSSAAGPTPSTTLHRLRNNEIITSTIFDSSRPWQNQGYAPPHRRSLQPTAAEVVASHAPQQDNWPVKVTIHAVDYEKMTLSATMEAYNVPSHPHSQQSLLNGSVDGASAPFTRTSSITTYLEGEILDFNQFTLLTESFKSDASNDVTYWRKLPPFQKFSDEELVKNLTSRRFFTEILNRDWILMRWKERCFVKSINRSNAVQPADRTSSSRPTDSFVSARGSRENFDQRGLESEQTSFDDSGCGLTISGFYYVCLKRSSGKLEGLYYDPQSSPYQCLKLDSGKGGIFPSWQFR